MIDGVLQATVITPGTETWNVQLLQGPFTLEKGNNYQVSFDIKASKQRIVGSNISMSGTPWKSYNDDYHFEVGTEFKKVTYMFEMKERTDNKSRIEFNYGADGGVVSVKNVSLQLLN